VSKIINPDPWSHFYTSQRKIIACATVIEEMMPYLDGIPYEILDFGLHLNPKNLKNVLQEKIDQVSKSTDVILLGYGLCSMAVVGLKASTATLVIPRVDDCIAIFLGSCDVYKEQSKQEPGTYYLTKGWLEVGDTPFEEHQKLIKKYGVIKAERMTKLLLKNYTRLAFINTGAYEIERYRQQAKDTATRFDLRYEEIDGSPELIEKMIHGPWDSEFVVASPGETFTYKQFANSNTPDSTTL
jgi:hypothetical protein